MGQDAEGRRISCSDKAYQRWSKPWAHRSRASTTSMVPPSRHEMSTVAPLPAAITAAAGARTCREAAEPRAAATMARRCPDRPARVLKEIPS
ncbi:hypothetical protein GCM10009767_28120 [Kocuria aegyptia]|uniref:Uncharacterized protein n=1 Tax=Kocuria aegyptia TaxID=330943 RepID=A0ABN2KWR4_9MICC